MSKDIWVIGENQAGTVEAGLGQLIAKALDIKAAGDRVLAILPLGAGFSPEQFDQAAGLGADELVFIDDDRAIEADDYLLGELLTALARQEQPDTILFSATALARSVAPRVQYALNTALNADVLDLYYDGDELVQVKPSFGDGLLAELTAGGHRPQMATVRPNTFQAQPAQTRSAVRVVKGAALTAAQSPYQTKDLLPSQRQAQNLGRAELVFAFGRGVTKAETIRQIQALAAKLGGAVGVTRPVAESNPDFSPEDQIGISGLSIAPKLLVNIGISGTTHYLAGVTNAKTILSVNTDSHAAIFEESDLYAVVDADGFVAGLAKAVGLGSAPLQDVRHSE